MCASPHTTIYVHWSTSARLLSSNMAIELLPVCLWTHASTTQTQFCMAQALQTYQYYSVYRTHLHAWQRTRNELSTFILHNLHWLPINYRIEYKVARLVFEIRSTGSPAYLLHAVSNYTTPTVIISTPSFQACCKNWNGKTFVQPAAPSVWNSLLVEIRVCETARQFRTAINRTQYYRLAFNYWLRDCFRSHDSTFTRRLK